MKCALHILADGTRLSAVAVIGGLSVCAACVDGVSLAIANEYPIRSVVMDARGGYTP